MIFMPFSGFLSSAFANIERHDGNTFNKRSSSILMYCFTEFLILNLTWLKIF